jgi:hypothetical protein
MQQEKHVGLFQARCQELSNTREARYNDALYNIANDCDVTIERFKRDIIALTEREETQFYVKNKWISLDMSIKECQVCGYEHGMFPAHTAAKFAVDDILKNRLGCGMCWERRDALFTWLEREGIEISLNGTYAPAFKLSTGKSIPYSEQVDKMIAEISDNIIIRATGWVIPVYDSIITDHITGRYADLICKAVDDKLWHKLGPGHKIITTWECKYGSLSRNNNDKHTYWEFKVSINKK